MKDTVDGFVKVAESKRSVGETINIGSGSGIAIGDLARKILDIMGCPDLPLCADEERIRPEKSEVMQLICNNRKAEELAGWTRAIRLTKGSAKR